MSEELLGLITKDAPPIPIPLIGVKVEGDIAGRGAKVRVVQSFRNEEDKPVEAVFKFPLPEGSAVCGFKAAIGDKIIEGDVEERDKAFELYDEALSKGHGAYLLDEERPNIFTLSVGNLNPGSLAIIEIEYVILLEARGPEVRFFLPTTISPRYIPDRTPDENGIPVDDIVTPVYSPDVPYGLSIILNIHGKDEISSIESPSHNIRSDFGSDLIRVEFSSETVRMDRDLVLNIKYKNGFKNRGYIHRGSDDTFLQIDFSPEVEELSGANKDSLHLPGKEIIFILDCSGSMSGNSISEAKKALEILRLFSLPMAR